MPRPEYTSSTTWQFPIHDSRPIELMVASWCYILGSLLDCWYACPAPPPPPLGPKKGTYSCSRVKKKPLFHEFGRQKVPLFLTNHEFSCVKYTPYFRVFITGIVATRSICTTFNGNREFLPRKGTLFYKNANRAPSSKMLIFGDAKYSQALKYKPCIGKISMVYLCKSK